MPEFFLIMITPACGKAHTFLRWLINSLRVVRGNAKDVTIPPFGSEEFIFLARRLRYELDAEHLRDDLLVMSPMCRRSIIVC